MGVEVEGSEVPKVNGEAAVVHDMENGKENASEAITFGSHGVEEEQSKGEVKNVSNPNLPKDAVDEWPAEPQVYSFWVVKYRPYEDPKLKAEMDLLDRDIHKKSIQISQIYDEINPKRAEKEELHAILSSLGEEKSQYQEFIDQKRKEMKPLQEALGDLRGPGRERGAAICNTEKELNALIRSLEYRIQHESVTLKEEKQIIRDIKELESTRPKVIANEAMRAKVQESMGQKEAIQDQVKLLGTDLDGVRKQKAAVQGKRDQLYAQTNVLKDQIDRLYTDMKGLKEKKQAALEAMQELRKKREAGNGDYYKNRGIINSIKELAAKKDVSALEGLASSEVEKFMSQWNSNKAFRNTYEKRILLSLDTRQLSRDARMRNPDEKPLVMVESPAPSEPAVASKATSKPQKEVSKTISKAAENLPVEKTQTETTKGNKESSKASVDQSIEEDIFVVEKPKKVSNGNEVDAAKMRAMKKEEEKEKQRQALERKKKQQEKAAVKAALKAQKEAEKKQKEREKKLKKKEGPSQPADEEEAAAEKADVDELEKSDNAEEATEVPAAPKAKVQKENSLKHRKSVKTRGTLPKAILKKKKSTNYLLWGSAGAAAVVVLLLLVLGYNYLQKPQVVG